MASKSLFVCMIIIILVQLNVGNKFLQVIAKQLDFNYVHYFNK